MGLERVHCGQVEEYGVLVLYACVTLRRNFLCVGGFMILCCNIVSVMPKNRMELAEKREGYVTLEMSAQFSALLTCNISVTLSKEGFWHVTSQLLWAKLGFDM